MTLRESRKRNFYNVILNTDQFAELVTYRRPGSPDAVITAIVRDAPEQLEQARHEELKEEKILVRIGRDACEPKGGIERPAIGDVILRSFAPDRPYSFQGDVREVTPHSFTLLFARRIPDQVGRR